MSTPSPSKGSYIPKLIIGLILMVGGMWLSTSEQGKSMLSFQAKLAEMGIPLDLGKTVAIIGVFLILFPVIDLFFLRPLQEAIGNRTRELESTFTEAESLRSQMGQLKTDYEQRLAKTEADAREQIQAQIKEAQELKKSLTADAVAKTEEMKRVAEAEIEAQKKQVLGELRVHVATLSLQASEKIMKENMDNDRNRKLIDDFLSTVEVKN
ncbi:MAG: F0F1 ATP synthase subunit B [Armatimonadota bacterium]